MLYFLGAVRQVYELMLAQDLSNVLYVFLKWMYTVKEQYF